MAAPEPNRQIARSGVRGTTYPSKHGPSPVYGHQVGGRKKELSRLEAVVIELYGRGVTRRKVARLMLKFLAPGDGKMNTAQRMRVAVRRLTQMESRKWFRDALWEYALIQADIETPQILAGVTRKAKEGRVDAAKLALGITGRYTETGDVQATQVNILFGSDIPRPASRGIPSQQEAEEVEDGEWDED